MPASPHRPSLRVVPAPAPDEGGSSNSRPTATSGRAGVDTVRYRVRGDDRLYDRARAAGITTAHARGEVRRVRDGVTVGAFPDGMGYVEARLATLLHGEDDHRLLPASELEAGAAAALELLGARASSTTVAVGRVDIASELVLSDPAEGQALLRAAAAVDLPWLKAGTEGNRRSGLETVYWRSVNGRSVHLRFYDKGRETGQAEAGVWLRLERQRRARKSREGTVADVLAGGLVASYVGRELAYLLDQGRELVVCGRSGALEELRRAVVAGRIGYRRAAPIAAMLALELDGMAPERSRRRWWRELRELGIALEPELGPATVVPFARYVRELVDQVEAIAA